MARPINLLSARFVQTTKVAGLHSDGGGLYFEVDAGGGKRWTFIWRTGKTRRQMGLGGTLVTDLVEARAMADTARRQLAKGLDPIAERKAARASGRTFGEAADELLAALKPQWRNPKHAYQWEYSLTVLAKPIRHLAVDAITTAHMVDLLKPIWSTINETASRTRGRIERVLDAEKAAGNRTGENPARWKGHLALLLPKRQKLSKGHHPAMPFEEIGDFIPLLRARSALSARALEFTILTASRTNEVLGAMRSEFDMIKRIWTVPADRMKLKVDHRVALSSRAVSLLEEVFADMPDPDGLVFGDAKGEKLSDAAMSTLFRKRMGFAAYSVHGFRSTFRDWVGEATSFPEAVAEAALSHLVGTDVERSYKRGDVLEKRRRMMEAWAGYCDRPKSANIIPIGRAR